MPCYEFICDCGENLVVEKSIHEEIETPTCKCGLVMRRVFFAPPTHFKGNGFYRTDKNG